MESLSSRPSAALTRRATCLAFQSALSYFRFWFILLLPALVQCVYLSWQTTTLVSRSFLETSSADSAHFAPAKQLRYSRLRSQLEFPDPTLKLIEWADNIAMNCCLEANRVQVIATSEITFDQLFDDAVVPWAHV